MVSIQQARALVLAQARSFGKEEIKLTEAFGRVLAAPVPADRDYPPFPRATMDGYALRSEDLLQGIRGFRVVEILIAGAIATRSIRSGDCYKIMTGAAVPGEADMVIRREDVTEGDGGIGLEGKDPQSWWPYLNIARRGEDLRAGEPAIPDACRCDPAVMGLLATLGITMVTVSRLPRVALMTTGNEVVEPGEPVGPVQIRNSNRWMLETAFRREGIVPVTSVHVEDDPKLLKKAVQAILPTDILVLTGGVSAGDADHVPAVLSELGVRKLFHKIAMRPGKPSFCGCLPGGGIVFALPGNPFSCRVNFELLIAPYLQACWGIERSTALGLPLAEGRPKRTPLDEFFPVRIGGRPAVAAAIPLNGSGDIRIGMGADALALHPAGEGDLPAGAVVECHIFS